MKLSLLKSATSRPPIIAAAAILVSFLLVHRLDVLLAQLQDQAGVTFDSRPPLVFAFMNQIILATTVLALAWLLLVRLPPNRIAAALFLAAGVFVMVYYLSAYSLIPVTLRSPFLLDLGMNSGFFHLATFTAIAGLATVARRSPPRPRTPVKGLHRSAA